jgi:SAM-dependent methyltransferase
LTFRRRAFRIFWWLEKKIDPGVVSSQNRYSELLTAYVQPDSVWLDLGCGHALFPDWIAGQNDLIERARFVAGIDYDQPSLKKNQQIRHLLAGDVNGLPFRSASFNLVTANMVVEHLNDPARALSEIRRVLAIGGHFIYHTPNRRFYATRIASLVPQALKNQIVEWSEGRAAEDVFPTYYRMNDLESVQTLARRGGFRVVTCRSLTTSSAGSILILGPFVIIELLIRRLLRWELFRGFRSVLIVVLQKES